MYQPYTTMSTLAHRTRLWVVHKPTGSLHSSPDGSTHVLLCTHVLPLYHHVCALACTRCYLQRHDYCRCSRCYLYCLPMPLTSCSWTCHARCPMYMQDGLPEPRERVRPRGGGRGERCEDVGAGLGCTLPDTSIAQDSVFKLLLGMPHR